MSDPLVTRYDVIFRASEEVDRRLLISLVLSQGGVAVSDGAPTFFLEPTDEVSPDETVLMARFLTKYVTSFGVIMRDANEPDEP